MKLGFLYAGQGSQHVGMGRDFYDQHPLFRDIFDSAPVDFDLKGLCFDGPEEQLGQTQYTQPCMVAFAAGVTALLYEQGIRPDYAAGLSLGEYSALHAAGVLDAKTAIELVAFRGRAMAEAVKDRPCSMAAVLKLDREPLQAACDGASHLGVVEIANYNCPGQLVIGGDAAAVDKACELAKAAGAKRCMPLKVSGPFHTSLMAPAGDALRARFQSVEFRPMAFPVVFNCTGNVLQAGQSIPALLERQVQSSVYLEDSIRRMAELGVEAFVEIGPGKALSGFVKKTVPGIPVYPVETAEDLEAVIAALKGEAV
jgi:[acyl-carrier-protein] S-malonyltransferase